MVCEGAILPCYAACHHSVHVQGQGGKVYGSKQQDAGIGSSTESRPSLFFYPAASSSWGPQLKKYTLGTLCSSLGGYMAVSFLFFERQKESMVNLVVLEGVHLKVFVSFVRFESHQLID